MVELSVLPLQRVDLALQLRDFRVVGQCIAIALVLELGMPTNDLKLFTAITVALALWLPQGKELLRTLKKSCAKEAA